MPLSAGARLGHYDVIAKIGEGGMGQVWQATDTQLNRQVALKILPDAFAADPERLARFTREAQILASLNHPNIAAIHGIEEAEGTRALVLELVYGLEGNLWAVRFHLNRLETVGDPVPVVEGVLSKASGAVDFGISDDGSLIYVTGGPTEAYGSARTLVWVDPAGLEEPLPLPVGRYSNPRLSPDGTRLAVRVAEQGQLSPGPQALWVYDVATGGALRLTHEGNTSAPVWTPDGGRVVFGWDVDGPLSLHSAPADGSGEIQKLPLGDVPAIGDFATAVTDDNTLLFARNFGRGRVELWEFPLGNEGAPVPILEGEFSRGNGELLPDGNWLAYRSNESGEAEIYLRRYPGPGPIVPVSIGGGTGLLISHDGSQIFYRRDSAVWAVDLTTVDGTVSPGTPRELFNDGHRAGGVREYHVAPDGRFLMIKDTPVAGEPSAAEELWLVQHWFEELKALVPVN